MVEKAEVQAGRYNRILPYMVVINVLCLAFILPGLIKFTNMVFVGKDNFYDIEDDIQCVKKSGGLNFKGKWFNWLKASIILTCFLSIYNILTMFWLGTDKPGERDARASKISIFANMGCILVMLIISFFLFGPISSNTISQADISLIESAKMAVQVADSALAAAELAAKNAADALIVANNSVDIANKLADDAKNGLASAASDSDKNYFMKMVIEADAAREKANTDRDNAATAAQAAENSMALARSAAKIAHDALLDVSVVVESYRARNNGDYCFTKYGSFQGGFLKALVIMWIVFLFFGVVMSFLVAKPLTFSEGNLLQKQKAFMNSYSE